MDGDTYQLSWKEFRTHLVKTQQHLYQDKHFTDVTLVGDDDIQFAAHKIVLSSCSPFFRRLLQNNPSPSPFTVYDRDKAPKLTINTAVHVLWRSEDFPGRHG